jgi:branched-chain amino acid transport system ATP-binding protein
MSSSQSSMPLKFAATHDDASPHVARQGDRVTTQHAPLLKVQGLTKRFGGIAAVSDMALSVAPGSVVGLMGPNGAGKTTTVSLISGLLQCDSGTVEFEGTQIQRLPAHKIALLGIARTYQNIRLFSGMTTLQQVMSGYFARSGASMLGAFLGLPKSRAIGNQARVHALELLERVGLAHRADVLAETLSYGEQRRVEIARALATNPRLLLLDEPTAGMNMQEATDIGRLVHELKDAGLAVLMIEHNVRLVMDFCEHVTVMNFGRLLANGTPQECMSHPQVKEAYFGKSDDANRFRTAS